MAHLFFRYANAEAVVVDPEGRDVDDLSDAPQYAVQVIQQLLNSAKSIDWRSWTLHVSDEEGEELFVMPFACVVGKLQ